MPNIKWIRGLLVFWVIAGLCGTFYSIASYRQQYADGASVMLHLITNKTFVIHDAHFRAFDAVLQLPALLIIWLSGNRDMTDWIIHAFNTSYAIHRWISLAICFMILRKRNRLDLLLFPLLGFACASQPTSPFAVGVVPLSLSIFWPLFLLVLLDKPTRWNITKALLLAACLTFTYETALLFLLLLAWMSATPPMHSTYEKTLGRIFGVACLAGAGFLAYRVLGPSATETGSFLESLLHGGRRAGLFYIGFGVSVSAALWAGACWPTKQDRLRKYLSRALLVFILWHGYRVVFTEIFARNVYDLHLSTWQAYNARTWAIPLAAFIALTCALIHRKDPAGHWARGRMAQTAWLGTTLVLFISVLNNVLITRQWRMGVDKLYALVADKRGCIVIDTEDYEQMARHGLADYTVWQLSIVLQGIRDGDRSISTIAIPEPYLERVVKEDPCEALKDGYIPEFHGTRWPLKLLERHFDFKELLHNATIQR